MAGVNSTTERERDYRDRLYESYVTTHAGEPPEEELQMAMTQVARRVEAPLDARILDIGCGQGSLVALLASRGYRNVQGIDVSAEQIEAARRRGVDGVEQADLFDYLRERPATFDTVIAIDLLEHFDKPDVLTVLDTIHDALVPGGALVAQVPNAISPFGGRYLYGDLTHGTAFTPRSVRQVLGATGYGAPEVYPCEPIPHGALSAIRWLLWKGISMILKASLIVETGMTREHIVTQDMLFRARRAG